MALLVISLVGGRGVEFSSATHGAAWGWCGSLSDPDTPIRTQYGYRCYQEGALEPLGKAGAGLSRRREQHPLRLSGG